MRTQFMIMLIVGAVLLVAVGGLTGLVVWRSVWGFWFWVPLSTCGWSSRGIWRGGRAMSRLCGPCRAMT
jgi:hypothetical protein